ncbi:MAG: hypothetical protein HYV02_01535 [Deltaproteobacteria bacterium]|nr:hypothetical protein [Deltaproteobacteria bacterium]
MAAMLRLFLMLSSLFLQVSPAVGAAKTTRSPFAHAAMARVTPLQMVQAQQQMPSMAALHAAVRAHAQLSSQTPVQWARRAKRAAWLPRLQLGTRYGFRDDLQLDLDDSVSVSGSGVVIGPRTSDFMSKNNRQWQFDLHALWDLNELMFTPDVIYISREARERRKELRGVLQEANRLYAQWRALAAMQLAQTNGTIVSELDFLTAELDALTGGWFSKSLAEIAGRRS